MPRLLPRLRTLRRDLRAATIIEFAAIAAPFVALILGSIQTSLVFFAQQCLETTSEETSRQLLTGAAQRSGMDQEDFAKVACKNLPSFMDCNNLMVDVQTADSFAEVDTSSPALSYDAKGNVKKNWQFHPGDPGSIIVMRTMYIMPVVSGPLGFNLSNMEGSRRLLIATAVFKSEQYPT